MTHFCPYPGLRPFNEQESLYFKGREKHIDKIKNELEQKKFLMVTGASGDGKSSLIYAGLLPDIRAGFFKSKFNIWKIAVFRPGNNPLVNLSRTIAAQIGVSDITSVQSSLSLGFSSLTDLYKNSNLFSENKIDKKGANLLIVVDQFEEFFTNRENFNRETAIPSHEAQTVVNLLIESAKISKRDNLPLYIICTMRSDYIRSAPAFRGLPELIGESQYFVPRLTRDEIQHVITEPAILSGNEVSERLTQRLLNDLNVINTDILPVLQHALKQTWLKAKNGEEKLDLSHYCMVGGMNIEDLPEEELKKYKSWTESEQEEQKRFYRHEKKRYKQTLNNILNLHANVLFENAHLIIQNPNLSRKDTQHILATSLKCLTKIDDSKAVRNRMTLSQIKDFCGEQYSIEDIISVLNIFRLPENTLIYPFINDAVAGSVSMQPDTLLDITHEALIRNWEFLKRWTKEEHDSVLEFKEINAQLKRWISAAKSENQLLNSGTYKHFSGWYLSQNPTGAWIERYLHEEIYKTDGIMLSPLTEEKNYNIENFPETGEALKTELSDYLNQSHFAIEKRRKSRKKIFTTITASMIIAVIGFIWAFFSRQEAIRLKEDITRTAKANELATQAFLTLEKDPTLAFRIAEQAYNIEPTLLANQVIMASYGEMPFYKKLTGHIDAVVIAKFSPDGQYILSGSLDKTARLWNKDGKLLAELKGHERAISIWGNDVVNFSPDSKQMITCSEDGTARLWNHSGKQRVVLKHNGKVQAAEFSPDGKYIVTASFDSTAKIWDANGKLLHLLSGHNGLVFRAHFSADNKYVITASWDGNIRIWDFQGNLLKKIQPRSGAIGEMDISTNADMIAVITGNKALKVYDFNGKELLSIPEHKAGNSKTLDFSNDHQFIAGVNLDEKTVIVYTIKGEQVCKLEGHTAQIWSIQFSPDDKYLITTSNDNTARLWDMNGTELMRFKGHTAQIHTANFSPDCCFVVTASADQSVRIWNIEPKENPLLKGHKGYVMDVNYSPNNQYLATAAWDYTARLWQASGKLEQVIKGHTGYSINSVLFFPDGKRLLTTSSHDNDQTIRIWDVSAYFDSAQHKSFNTGLHRNELHVLRGHRTSQSLYANISKNERHILSYSEDDQTVRLWDIDGKELLKVNDAIVGEFSPDNQQLLAIHTDTSLKIYYLTGALLFQLKGHSRQLKSAAFSPTGKWLGSSAQDSTVIIWDYNAMMKKTKNHIYYPKKNQTVIIRLPAIPERIVFSPDEKYLLIIGNDNIVSIYHPDGKLKSRIIGHSEYIMDAGFSENSQYIVTGSLDFTARVWDLEGRQLQTIANHKGVIMKAKFFKNDQYIITCSHDNTARITPWRVEDVLRKINVEKVRGDVWEMDEKDKEVYGIQTK